MKITRISYARLESGPGYENERYEVSADVADGEDAEAAADDLRRFVRSQFEHQVADELSAELTELAAKVASARQLWEKAQDSTAGLPGAVPECPF